MIDNRDLNSVHAVSDYVYIIEKSEVLKPVVPNSYTYEGICAKFGIVNQNKRIYEKDEYLPHLSYLNAKIAQRRLVGELDHPASYDISLKNISHIVEKLWYDASDNTVKIRISLLDTPMGKVARTLADAGVPISISSRAAGQVMNEGRVKLHQIFTFDIVAEPGFAEAVLAPSIAESLKTNYEMISESLNTIKTHSIIKGLNDISEGLKLENNVRVYKINKEDKGFFEALVSNPVIQNNENTMKEHLTKEEFNEYTKVLGTELNEKFANLTKQLADLIKEAKEDDEEGGEKKEPKEGNVAADIAAEVKDVPGEGGENEEVGAPAGDKTELENLKDTDSKDDIIRKLVTYVNYLATQIDALIGFGNYLGEMVNKGIYYTENVGEMANALANHNNYLSEKLNQTINFTDKIAKTLNEGLNHNDYLSKMMNMIIGHNDMLAEKINTVIDFADYQGSMLEKHMHYTDYMASVLNSGIITERHVDDVPRNLDQNVTTLTESKVVSLKDDVKKLISEIKSESKDAVLEQKYPFLKLLSADDKNKFYAFESELKKDIIATVESAIYTTREDVIQIIEAVIANRNNKVPMYLRYMPEKYKEIYEKMTNEEKAHVANQASTQVMTTPYQVKTFWDTRDFFGVKERIIAENKAAEQVKSSNLNESQSKEGYISKDQFTNMRRGYSMDLVEQIGRMAPRK